MEDANGRKLYVCLRCGNKFWSKAKKPQCSVCKSKRVVPYEEFLKLPEEEREKILGKREAKKESEAKSEEAKAKKKAEETAKVVNLEVEEREKEVKHEDKPVKSGESPKIPRVKVSEKPGEKVKGEKVKRLRIPRLGWKAYAVLAGLAFAYYLYHIGWFDEMFRQLKRLGAVKDMPEPGEKEKKPIVRSPVLGKIEKNLGRG